MPLPRRFAFLLAPALALPLTISSFALAAPPTDEKIDALIARIDGAGADVKEAAAKRQARRDAAKEALAETPLTEATVAQLKKLHDKRLTNGNTELVEAMDARLSELTADTSVDGARAAELQLTILPPAEATPEARKAREGKLAALTAKALTHPGAEQLFKSGGGDGIIRGVATVSPEAMKDHKLIELLTPRITTDLSPSVANSLSTLVHPLVGMKDELGAEKFNAIRTKIAAAAEAGAEKARIAGKERLAKAASEPKKEGEEAEKAAKIAENVAKAEEAQIKRLGDLRTLATGAWARGELVGHTAPAISIAWSSTEKPIKSFADLKGKVVLVDFWATWCGPCVAAFPKMRELQSRYAGYPVVILGLTSAQGDRAMERKPGQKAALVDCTGNPGKEHDLMKEFMLDMNMTWPVAFSEENVFNPDFGVRGIPHMALIDAAGIVRHGRLFPPNVKEESDHIDALLKEAKLPYPEQPYVEPKKEDAKKDEPKKG